MKLVKKMTAVIIALCMTVMVLPFSVNAAEPQLRFSDPTTTQGATFDVEATFYADAGIGDVNATLTYDAAALKFISGDGATASNGQIQLTGNGGGSTEMKWTLQFQALAVQTTSITIASVSASSTDGTSFQVAQGSSTITIGEGDPSLIDSTDSSGETGAASGVQVDVDGQTYSVVDFSDILIPTGFTKTEMTFEGQTCPAALQESSGKYAVYLSDSEGEENFFLYDPDGGTFSPFEQIEVSQDRYIIPLTEEVGSQLPSNLQETTFTVNGKDFPAWQNVDSTDYYVLYALNSDGEKGFYQYDSIDDTYQRYTPDTSSQEEQNESSSLLGGLIDTLRDNLDRFLVGTWVLFLIFLIIIIILAIKLRHRNLELDDLYDEYDIDVDEEEDKKASKKAAKDKKAPAAKKEKASKAKAAVMEDDDFDDDFDDYDDGFEYEDDDFDDYEDDGEDFEEDDFSANDDFEEDDDFDDDVFRVQSRESVEDDIDDLDALLEARVREPAKRPPRTPKKRSHAEEDDTFKMDIIDLD